MVITQLDNLQSFCAEAEGWDVDFITQHIIESKPQLGLNRQCLGELIKGLVTHMVRGVASGHAMPDVLLAEGPILLVRFFRCQFGFSEVQAQAAMGTCTLDLVRNLFRGDDFTTALGKFVSCIFSKGASPDGNIPPTGQQPPVGGSQPPAGGGNPQQSPQLKSVVRCP